MSKQTAIFRFELPESCRSCLLYDGEYEVCMAGAFGRGYEREDVVRFGDMRHERCPLEIEVQP